MSTAAHAPTPGQQEHTRTALYIHIPFCLQRCLYCDFNTYAGLLALRPAYGEALKQELQTWRARLGADWHPASVYFGGGTPSLMPANLIAELLRLAEPAPDAEITLEANPGTVSEAYLLSLREGGVNRLSLGVQAYPDQALRRLGRIHTWEEAVASVRLARAAGFTHLSLDVMFGLPGQTLEAWRETLEAVLALAPEHLSLYALTLEEGTPLAEQVAAGDLPAPDAEVAAAMYELASERLGQAGFWQYEISNWARGHHNPPTLWPYPPAGRTEALGPWVARHNLTYWRNEPWLGLGAGAHSWLGGRRWANLAQPDAYIAALRASQSPVAEVEDIPLTLEMGETMMLGLRLAEGVDAARFQSRFGRSLAAVYAEVLPPLLRQGLVEWREGHLRLTEHGRLLGNHVFAAFLP